MKLPLSRLDASGASTGAVATFDGTDWGPGAPSSSAGVLAVVEANSAAAWVTTTSTSYTDLDATHAQITFTAPTSGRVLINLSAAGFSDNTTNLVWGLRDLSNTLIKAQTVAQGGSTSDWTRQFAQLLVTGLTAGTSYTYKWSIRSAASGSTAGTYGGDADVPAVLTVQAY